MSVVQEMFARVWYVGLALSPVLLLACCHLRSKATASQRHAVGVAVLVALLISACLPSVQEPGALLANAREEFKSAGLAPCHTVRIDAAPSCLTFTQAGPWAIGCLLLLGWYGLGRIATSRLRRRAEPAPPATEREVRATAAQLAIACPRIGMLPTPCSPMVIGVVRPMLLLPATLWPQLNATSREAILRHELAHLRRRDLLSQQVAHLARALFWWHPVVWWLRHELARSAERAADSVAVGPASERAESLARGLLTIQRYGRTTLASGNAIFALSTTARDLRDRLGEMFEPPTSSGCPRLFASMAFASALAIGWASVQVTLG